MSKRIAIISATGIQVRNPVLPLFIRTRAKEIMGRLSPTHSSTLQYGKLGASHVAHQVKSLKLYPKNESRLSKATSMTRLSSLRP